MTTGDELGELAASFNEMAAGLAEREKIRDAFGTYLDREVAEYILSDGFDEEGMATEVSVLFVDVVDFTSFAARAEAREVVACLNALFEIVVPVISRHGGHVDKFEGDGLLAVFGAPERMPDHADRAVRAALEMTRRVNGEAGITGDGDGASQGEVDFRIGAGINTGEVVAGAIGGGGRLNFSVIGDPVNVAARVEAVTRKTGDDVLITEATRDALRNDFQLSERGRVELKGIDEPVHLFAPRPRPGGRPPAAVAGAGHPRGIRSGDPAIPHLSRMRWASTGPDRRGGARSVGSPRWQPSSRRRRPTRPRPRIPPRVAPSTAAGSPRGRSASRGVSKLFTLSGGHLFSLYDGCKEEGIDVVDTRHEQAAAWAAEGWAKATREPGVARAHGGARGDQRDERDRGSAVQRLAARRPRRPRARDALGRRLASGDRPRAVRLPAREGRRDREGRRRDPRGHRPRDRRGRSAAHRPDLPRLPARRRLHGGRGGGPARARGRKARARRRRGRAGASSSPAPSAR